MTDLRSLVSQDTYQDDPSFSDQLLLPAIATGQSVSLVTAFAPSYLYRLVGDLASSPEIEPGKLSVTFCVPLSLGSGLSKARLLSRFLSAFAEDAQEVKTALEAMLQLVKEGGLTLGALYSSDSKLLTPSCIGVVESGVPGSNDYLGFVDFSAGDLNSPIDINASWDADSGGLGSVTQIVVDAKSRDYSHLERLPHSDVVALLKEVLQNGYPKRDIAARDGDRVKQAKPKKEKAPVRTRKTLIDEGPKDWEVFALEDELSYEDQEFELLIGDLGKYSNRRGSGYLYDFLGDPDLGEEVAYLDLSDERRNHVGPLPSVVASMVGNGFAECWCGELFDRLAGCPSNYS
jgi:hypothetical protein